MKLLVASDLHGSAFWTRKLIDILPKEAPDRILLLGDLLYHGPRNDLPRDYAPKEVISLLSPLAGKLLCVRGNCDTEVDQMVLPFPILADYAVLCIGNRLIYASHGHHPETVVPYLENTGNVYLQGHTHVPMCEEKNGYLHVNPGSVSIPKENSPHSYLTLEDGLFLWKDLETKEVYREFRI